MSEKAEIWQCPECGAALDISALGFYAEVECEACAYRERVHTMLANFRVEGVVGIGGMSVVLRARDLVLNRPVAIKVLNDTYRNQPDRISRFENECAMMAKVRHENVVSVFSAGRARKQFYIVMELVDGLDLETLITREGPLDPQKAVDYTIQVVEGLNAAHKSGLLHRDMKPGNVIITPDGHAKVLDFGLALGRKDEDTEEIIWATPYYVPPETLERKEEDERTDIYALGMTLRYLLTGKGSFGDSPASVSELLRKKAHLPAATSILSGVDETLCDLVDHMTAYEPSKRPVSYRALLSELRAVQNALQLSKEANAPENKRKARRELFVGAGITFVLGVAAAVVAMSIATPPGERSRLVPAGEYVLPVQQALQQAENALLEEKFEAAYNIFRNFSGEFGVAAWAALNAATLAELQNRPQEAEEALLLFQSYMQEREQASPAGKELLQAMEAVAAAREGKTVADSAMQNSVVRLLHYFWLSRNLCRAGRGAEGQAAMDKAIQEAAELSQNGVAYGAYGKYFESMPTAWAPVEKPSLAQQIEQALAQHRLKEAREKLSEFLRQENLPPKDSTEANVLLELCDVAEAAFAVLLRRCGSLYEPGASPENMASLAASLNIPYFDEQLRVLCLLLNKQYQQAFSLCDSLTSASPDSPFAILTRDWRERLQNAEGE